MCSARLACVKHAASVHPEPGSNSHKKCCNPVQESAWLFYPLFYCFKVDVVVHLFFEFHSPELRKLLFLSHGWSLSRPCLHELSRLFHCSIINVLCCLVCFVPDSFLSLPNLPICQVLFQLFRLYFRPRLTDTMFPTASCKFRTPIIRIPSIGSSAFTDILRHDNCCKSQLFRL